MSDRSRSAVATKVSLAVAAASLLALGAAVVVASRSSAADQPDLSASIEEATKFIRSSRGLELTSPIPVVLLSDDEFRAFVTDGAVEMEPDIESLLAGEQRALGFSAPDSFAALITQSDADDILGLYDPVSQRVFVRDQPIDRAVTETILHELVHAVQDQHFGLLPSGLLSFDEELAWTSLVEGDATAVELAWERANPAPIIEEAAFETQLPLGVLVDAALPYVLGPGYVELTRSLGVAVLDSRYSEPPTSTQQLMRPWLDLESASASASARVDLGGATPAAQGEIVSVGDRGAAHLAMTIAGVTGDSALGWSAGEAWAGDTYQVSLESDDTVCITWSVFARDGFEPQLAEAMRGYANSSAAELTDDTTIHSCDPGQEAKLLSPADGLDSFRTISTAIAMLHWIGPGNDADCIITELLAAREIANAWQLQDPSSHPTFTEAGLSCAIGKAGQ